MKRLMWVKVPLVAFNDRTYSAVFIHGIRPLERCTQVIRLDQGRGLGPKLGVQMMLSPFIIRAAGRSPASCGPPGGRCSR